MIDELAVEAIMSASVLQKQHGLDDAFVQRVMEGRLHYSIASLPHNVGAFVEIERDSNTMFARLVRDFETNLSAYVYHCILTGPFLTLLFTSNYVDKTCKRPKDGQAEVYAAVLDIDKQDLYFMDVRLASFDGVLVRTD